MENGVPQNIQDLVTKKELEELLAEQTTVILGAVDQRLVKQEDKITKTMGERFQGVDDRLSAHDLRMTNRGQIPDRPEPVTTPAAALERARASLARGEGIPHDEVLREFGLKK